MGAFAAPSGIVIPPKLDSLTVDYGCNSNCINVNIFLISLPKVNDITLIDAFKMLRP